MYMKTLVGEESSGLSSIKERVCSCASHSVVTNHCGLRLTQPGRFLCDVILIGRSSFRLCKIRHNRESIIVAKLTAAAAECDDFKWFHKIGNFRDLRL